MRRFLDRSFTVGNMACLMQILLAIGIATSPITPVSAAARVQEFSGITPFAVFVVFIAFGSVGLVYGLIRTHSPVSIMLFNAPFLFYGCSVSAASVLYGYSFAGVATFGSIVLIITAHLWQRTRHD
jgi:polyferredoxin